LPPSDAALSSGPVQTADSLSPGLRRFIFLTAAFNGAAIMVIEILGAKMLAPFFGTSHFVWTAQIGVVMASLAVGYYIGGRWADATGNLGRLFGGMLAAAGYLCLGVLGLRAVATVCLGFSLAVGSLEAAAFLYFVPLVLLAMTGPFLVRFITSHLKNVGGSVGRLSAVSTVGSLVGTAAIGYVLIPLSPNSVTMLATAGVLALLALVFFAVWSRSAKRASVATVAIALLGVVAGVQSNQPEFANHRELFRGNSNFGRLQVIESRDGHRYYLNDYLMQNTYEPSSKQSLSLFTYALHDLAIAYTARLDSVLCIGMGVGIVPGRFAAEGLRVDVVEINPAVVPVAQKFFDLDVSRLNLVIGDGRQVLNGNTNRYDAVILDAFLGDSSPSHLMTREAFTAVRAVMHEQGVLVINCFGDRTPGKDFFAASLQKTLRAVFADVRLHESGNGNMFFVASPSPLSPKRQVELSRVHPDLRGQMSEVLNGIFEADPTHGIVMTDDFNPADYYDAENRQHIRRNLAYAMLRRF
jgi:spermidine synthase